MIGFSETFFRITMVNGLKQYLPDHDTFFTAYFQVSKITNVRELNSESYPSYSQTEKPYTHVKGRKFEQYKIEGPLCRSNEASEFLSKYCSTGTIDYGHGGRTRSVNRLYNVFLPCSIIICDYNDGHEEIPINSKWIVERFEITRSVAKRQVIFYSLTLSRIYQELIND